MVIANIPDETSLHGETTHLVKSEMGVRKTSLAEDINRGFDRVDLLSPHYDGDLHYEVRRLQAILEHERRRGAALRKENQHLKRKVETLARGKKSLVQLSFRDELTGLYNRRYFSQRLKEEISRANRYNYQVTCLMLDVDYFKEINDTFGHPTGDIILKEFSRRLHQYVRDVDILSRWGGEEFVIILPHTRREHGVVMAERIRKKIEESPFEANGYTLRITVSIGVASLEHPSGRDEHELIGNADQALYQAKRSGRNRVAAFRES